MAKVTKSQTIGATGESLVAKLVSQMGHIWRPNQAADYGIDGQIEIVDRNSQPTGNTVSVQVKTTAAERLPSETDGSFSWTLSEEKLKYWLGASEPVLLVVVQLNPERAWWKRLDTWFADPRRRKSRVVEFDKVEDLLGRASIHQLAAAATPVHNPLPLVRASETLTTNLLTLESVAPTINWAEAAVSSRQEAWAAMKLNGAYESGFILSSGRIYSFAGLDGPLSAICKGYPQSFSTAEWEESQDQDTLHHYSSLLGFTLKATHYNELRFHDGEHFYYHKASTDLRPRKLKVGKTGGRTVFEVYRDKENEVRYCRHYAAFLNFRHWDGQWYLEINPTYHFTRDGERESRFASEQRSTIKRIERNAAVRGAVIHWAQFLTQVQNDTLFGQGDRRLVFGQLATVTVDAAIDEHTWIVPKEAPSDEVARSFEAGEAS